ncbi:MAG: hypothetical protein WCX30_01545 [Candidatus Paceibacterota bacterium]|jgi:hypothetical protein|nr:hypothetical protein [bacterium]
MEFTISKNEINRRGKAFITLLTSMTVGLFLGSLFFNYPISIYGYLLVALAFFFLSAITFVFFILISKTKIYISDNGIKKISGKLSESFLLSDVKSIKVKRRTNGVIREIYITFKGQKELVITAFEKDFEEIRNLLISELRGDVIVKETHEPINFDHPLFYSILGLPISFMGIFFIKILTTLDYDQIKYILFALSVYVVLVGIYFIFKKPIAIRAGKKRVIADYIIGLIIICGSIFIFFVGLGL